MRQLAALVCLGVCLGTCLMLAGCSETRAGDDEAAVTPLDAAAIEAGVIADPEVLDLAGSFADTGGTGSDAFCARGNREQGYAVGVLVTFGGASQCEGQGRAALTGEQAQISLTRTSSGDAVDDCSFTARFDGSALALAGSLPAACQAVCSNRASLAGASFALVENGDSAAQSTRGRDIGQLCGG
jgi:hypothetical protein